MCDASPSSLIDREQSGAFVFGVICDYDTHEQCQADHATEENINVYIDCMKLKREYNEKEITYDGNNVSNFEKNNNSQDQEP